MSDKSSFLKSESLSVYGLEGGLKAFKSFFKRIKRESKAKSKVMVLASLVSFQEQKQEQSIDNVFRYAHTF